MKIKSKKSLEPDVSDVIKKIKDIGGDRIKFIVLFALYIQNEILSTGEVLYYSDYTEVFNTSMKTIREFDDFKPRLELYYSSMGV